MPRLTTSFVRDLYKLQVIRFIAVGFFSFAIEFVLFSFLVDLMHIRYTHANIPAMGTAIVVNYFLTRWLVFEAGRYNNRVTFVLFVTFTLAGVILNQFLLWYFVEHLLLNVKLSKIGAVGLVAVFNYLTKKHFVF